MSKTVITQKRRQVIEVAPKFSVSGVTNHEELTGRGEADQHPISAITDLQAELDGKEDALGFNVADKIANAQKEIAGVVTFDLTNESGTTHTVTILQEHSGKTIHILANLDDEVTIVAGNDIETNQPITIRKTGEFSLELRAANTDIVIEANGVEDDAGIDYVDISGDLINTVQIMKASENVIWGIGI